MIQIQMKCQLEARNKILIQKKIESHQKARKQLLQRYFSHWSQIIITRRKQQGTALAMADWRRTARVFSRWKRFTKSEKQKRIVHNEKHQARRIEEFKTKLIGSKDRHLLVKIFHAWRIAARKVWVA